MNNNSSPEFEPQPLRDPVECSNELLVLRTRRLYKLPQENADLLPV